MFNLLSGVPLFRAFGIQVVMSWIFIVYAVFRVVNSGGRQDMAGEILWLVVLFGTVLVHEFGHSLTCKLFKGDAPVIVLWPLGGLAFVSPPNRPWPHLWTTVGGPATHLLMGPIWLVLYLFVVPFLPNAMWAEYFAVACIYGIAINIGLLAFNLIPAYPMDGGRILQELLWLTIGYRQSLMIAGMVGTVAGAGFVVIGLGLWPVKIPWLEFDPRTGVGWGHFTLGQGPSMMLFVIGIMCALESFGAYRRAQELEGWRKN